MQDGEEDAENATELDSEFERETLSYGEQPGAPEWQRH
jgi:hypothetical protein